MKGLIWKAVAVFSCTVVVGLGGCTHTCGGDGSCGSASCKDLYDHCYPQRYWDASRKNVDSAFTPQVQNGHVLDQTVWNHHFEPGTDHLTPGGLEHLAYLSRRRPCPDTTVFLQTAYDLTYDPACPENMAGARQELDTRRIQAIQKYLVANTAGLEFHVLIHDPADPSLPAIPVNTALLQSWVNFRGILRTAGAGATGGAGAR
jgi:hypothetical protein